MIPDNQTLSSLNHKNPNGTVSVEVSSISADKAILTVKDFSFDNYEDLSIIIKETEFSEPAPLDFSISDTSLILNLSSLRSHFEFRRSKEFRIYILGVHDQKAELFLLKDKSQKAAPWNNFHLFTEEIYFDEDSAIRPTEYIGVLSADSKDNLCIHLCSRNKYLAQTHYCSLRSLKMNGGKLKICYDLETGYHEYVKTELSFRNKLAEDAVTYDFTTLSTNKRGNLLRIKISLDLNKVDWKSLYWDVNVLLYNQGNNKTNHISISMDTKQRMFQKFLYNGSYKTDNGFFFYPYYTGKKTLACVYRNKGNYDGLDIIFKEFTAIFLYRLAKSYWNKKHICLVSEKFASMAQDNGYYFFKHCMDENEEAYLHKKIYYIISKDSPDHYKVDPYKKNVINFMSIRHMIYTQAADLIVSSDSRYHTYAMQCRHSIFNRYLRKKKFVFLQHGVIALKRVDAFYSKGMRGGCDLFVVSTNQEKQTIVDNFGYEPDEVINTGLPRWDVLEDTSNGNREILIMPTWRSWLDSVPDKDFEESDYFRHYMALLNSSHFSQLLEKYDLQVLRFFMLSAHYRSPLNFSADLMEASKNGLERIVNAADNLKFLMGNAKAEAITDAEAENFAKTEEFVAGFEKAMDDDFNTADAVAAIFDLVKYINTTTDAESSKEYLQKLFDLLVKLTGVLGLIVDKKEEILDEDIEKLIEERQAARKAKDFARADAIRDELLEKGIILKDTREGVQWKRA